MASQTTSRDVAVEYEGLVHKQAQPVARTSRKWYFLGAGLALLGVAGVAAKATSSGGVLFSSSAARKGTIQAAETWEELPGIDKVIRKAQSLKQEKPMRNLQDLFYDSQPEELPWIRTECVSHYEIASSSSTSTAVVGLQTDWASPLQMLKSTDYFKSVSVRDWVSLHKAWPSLEQNSTDDYTFTRHILPRSVREILSS
eukprot:s1463_g1.t1